MTFLLFVGLVVLFVMHLQLRTRVEVLEKEQSVSGKTKDPVTAAAAHTAPEATIAPPTSDKPLLWPEVTGVTAATPATATTPRVASVPLAGTVADPAATVFAPSSVQTVSPPTEFFVARWFRDQPLIKIGGILFFLGAVWLVGYAIAEGWLRPEMQILLGLLLAMGCYAIGWWRMVTETVQGVVMTALGTGIAMATIFAGQQLYELFPSPLALGLLCAAIAYTVLVSVRTATEWLAVASVAAGFLAPLLVNAPAPSYPLLLSYLFILSAGFSVLVVLTQWRSVTLVTVVGAYLYQAGLLDNALDPLLWFFVVITTALFFGSVATSLLRTNEVVWQDVLSLAIMGVFLSVFASQLAASASIALFIATIIVAGTGYWFRLQGLAPAVQSVMAGFAFGALLVGTSFLFSGYQLALAYAVEVTLVFLLLTRLGVQTAVRNWTIAAFALPLVASLDALVGNAWATGIWHGEAVLVLVIISMLFGVALWCREQVNVSATSWSSGVARGFALVGYSYTIIAIQRFAEGLAYQTTVSEVVIMYVLWGLLTLTFVFYVAWRRRSFRSLRYALMSGILPLLFSVGSLTAAAWNNSVIHSHAFGVVTILVLLLFITVLVYDYESRSTAPAAVRSWRGALSLLILGYVFLVLGRVSDGVFESVELSRVALYVSYACLLYGVIAVMVNLKMAWEWVRVVLFICVVPGLLSLDSLVSPGWREGALHPDALGLYVCATIATLLAVGLYTRASWYPASTTDVRWYAKIFAVSAGLYAFIAVWLVSGALLASEAFAVVVALFIYSVAGLLLYSYGRARGQAEVRYAGILLLVAVVLRLALVDVWNMEQIWKIVTFLGIGLLFILTALFEKPFQKGKRDRGAQEHTPQSATDTQG
jgi:uncharacterized membrane protein